jgi:hypothetical protein
LQLAKEKMNAYPMPTRYLIEDSFSERSMIDLVVSRSLKILH